MTPKLSDRVEQAIVRPSTEEWREHDGGGRPHPASSYVEVEVRDGTIMHEYSALLLWPWEQDEPDDDDIMRWRPHPRPLSTVEAGILLIENAAEIAAALRARGL